MNFSWFDHILRTLTIPSNLTRSHVKRIRDHNMAPLPFCLSRFLATRIELVLQRKHLEIEHILLLIPVNCGETVRTSTISWSCCGSIVGREKGGEMSAQSRLEDDDCVAEYANVHFDGAELGWR
jgi:hypothetical protein